MSNETNAGNTEYRAADLQRSQTTCREEQMRRTLAAMCLWLATATWPCLAPAVDAEAESPVPRPLGRWMLTVYGGIGTDGGIEELPGLEADFNDAYMLTVACSREVARWSDRVTLEVEGQVAKHFKKQHHGEGNLLLAARWIKFPWNDCLRTSIAIGEGVSYASSVPAIEEERSPNETSKLLNYLMFELELAPPNQNHWSVVTRIHHRSGVHGLYNGVSLGQTSWVSA